MSSYSQNVSFIFLLSFVFILKTSLAVDPLFHNCSLIDGNFPPNSPFLTNLNTLTTYLQSKTSPSGFARSSRGEYPDKVNGLTLCRGDVTSSDCTACVREASAEIRRRCPSSKGAIIWYDNCLLKYSSLDFFTQIDDQNKFYLTSGVYVNGDRNVFNNKVKGFLSQLVDNQVTNTCSFYATGETRLDESTNLYGLAQCTRDLSSEDCKVCLDKAISELPGCCGGQLGARVVGGSCYVRFETYSFLRS